MPKAPTKAKEAGEAEQEDEEATKETEPVKTTPAQQEYEEIIIHLHLLDGVRDPPAKQEDEEPVKQPRRESPGVRGPGVQEDEVQESTPTEAGGGGHSLDKQEDDELVKDTLAEREAEEVVKESTPAVLQE